MDCEAKMPPVNRWKKILDFALFIGERLIENGAEIHRVEETVAFICRAYGCAFVDVYAIPNMIEATVEAEDEYYTTKLKRIHSTGTNLYNIERLNSLSRKVCTEKPDPDLLEEMAHDFDKEKSPKHKFLMYLGVFVGCFGFTMFFAGTWRDGLAAGMAALIMGLYLFSNHKIINKLVDTLIVSLAGGFVAALLCKIGIGEHVSSVMIGSLMVVIPGMALGNSFKDILMDDLLSGSIRFLQSIATAAIIAVGYAAAAAVFRNDIEILPLDMKIWQLCLYGGIGTLGFSLVFNNNYRHLATIGIGAVIVSAVYGVCEYFDLHEIICNMIASVIGLFYAETAARFHKAPSICFLTPIILPLAPGYSLYCTMFFFMNLSTMQEKFTQYLLNTLYISFGIGGGIIIGMVIVSAIQAMVVFLRKKTKKA